MTLTSRPLPPTISAPSPFMRDPLQYSGPPAAHCAAMVPEPPRSNQWFAALFTHPAADAHGDGFASSLRHRGAHQG